MKIIVVLLAWLLVVLVLYLYTIKKTDDIKLEKRKTVLVNTVQEEYDKKCSYVFTKCREKQVSNFDSPEELEVLKIISASYGINDIEEAKKCYKLGKDIVESAEIEEEKRLIAELRARDYREFEDAEKRANIKGKDKYISYLEKLYQDALKTAELAGEKPDDEPEEENIKSKKASLNEVSLAYSTVSAYKLAINKHKDAIENFHKRICDETNIEEKFKHLEFSNLSTIFLKSKNIRVAGFVKVDEELTLLGSKALLDGSLKISILDPDQNVIGYGYYSTGSFDSKGALIEAGFAKYEKRFSAICIIDDYEKVSEEIEYTYKIEPVNMWLIEC